MMMPPTMVISTYCQLHSVRNFIYHRMISLTSQTSALRYSLNKLLKQGNCHPGTGLSLSQPYSGRVSYIRSLSFTYRVRLDSLSFGTSSSSSHKLNVQPFDESPPQHTTCPEEQTLPGPSATHYQESHVPPAQASQEKVRCTWLGCTSVVHKNNYARHLNESHLRRVKAICHRCGRTFPRTYMKRNHEFTCRA